jgi:hypothetical protein
MKQIWKFKVNGIIQMPADATILAVQSQNGEPHIWALVNPENKMDARMFTIVRTGQLFEDEGTDYIGTFQDEQFVWHLFEILINKS